ncbi:MAG: RimK family alpha-L-glutamate ligase [Bacteroidales bacterium]|nr:RimK family alpha-L-glutamate ligase [Bacteroidales bacterium]
MKKVLFLYPATTPRSSNAFGWFSESFAKYGMEVDIQFWGEDGTIPGIESLPKPDAVVMRGYNSTLSQWFENQGVRVVNSTASMELCRDKIETVRALEEGGIPTPRTLLYSSGYPSWGDLMGDFSGEPVVMKLSMGSKGEDVFLLECEEDYIAAKCYCDSSPLLEEGARVMFQEYISTSRGRDLRVWVIGGEVVGHTLRSNPSGFKSNFAQGGNALSVELPAAASDLAVRAANVLGLDFAGVDILFGGGKFPEFLVCEVNGNAGFRTASLLGEFDIPTALASFIGKIF